MGIFELMEQCQHEQLIFCYNAFTKLKGIIAIHDTTLGNAVGGCRLRKYKSEQEMITDALKLSEIMTYQSAVADSDTGGGKAVLWQDFEEEPDESYFRAFGRFVEGLKGSFITYSDLGTTANDMKYTRRETNHVIMYETAGQDVAEGAEITACGVYWGMKACVKEVFGVSSMKGLTVAIQGVGNVGRRLINCLKAKEDVRLVITDLNYDSIKKIQDEHPDAKIVKPDEIIGVQCEIFSPCAVGGVITKNNVSQLKCKIVAGAAYDIFEEQSLSEELYQKKVLVAPDFVINSGELFLTGDYLKILSKEEALKAVEKIYDILAKIIAVSKREKISPYQVAYHLAKDRIKKVGAIKNILC
jgi:leucine dehydrogenase